jgi:hypothetical protein
VLFRSNLCIFFIGLILGRLTMAIQYAVMKPSKQVKAGQ